MKILVFIFAFASSSCSAAVRAQVGLSDFKTTKGTAAQQNAFVAQITNHSSITIAAWVKYDRTDASVNAQLGAGAKQGLVSKGRFETSGGDGFQQFGLSSVSEQLRFSFSSPNGTYHRWTTAATAVQTNTWMHIAATFTYSNGNSLVFYINGTNANGSWTTGSGDAVGQTNASTFHTFVYEQNGAASFFGGAMSDLAIWTNALLAGEITKLSSSKMKYMPIQVKPDALLFYWPMDTTPILPTVSGANNIDIDRKNRFNMDVGGLMYGERTLSYQPNE